MVERDDYPSVPSRFERLIAQTSFLDAIIATRKVTRGTNEALRSKPHKETKALRGTPPVSKMFSGKLTFAPAYNDAKVDHGTPWSEPWPNPVRNKPYYVSLEISQLQGDGPLSQLQGFKTYWTHPPNWTWLDGHGATLYDEAITNPLFIRRLVQSPGTIGTKGFKVVVQAVYRP